MPCCVQRRRARGWRLPAHTIYVGRPTAWGNPFPVYRFGRETAVTRWSTEMLRQGSHLLNDGAKSRR